MIKSTTPGLLVLLGSGETQPSSGKAHEYVAQRLPENGRVAILETPAGFEPNSAAVAGKIKTYMDKRLQNYNLQIEILPARKKGTPNSPDNPEVVHPLYYADEILLGPGSPTYGARQLRGSLAAEIIKARHRLGATLFLSSSSVLAFGVKTMPVYEIYKVGQDLHWQEGVDITGLYGFPLVVIPHWDNTDGGTELDTSHCYVGTNRFNRLQAMLDPAQPILGIDEHTAVVIDFKEQCCHVMGKGRAIIVRDKQETIFRTGESFPITELGKYMPPPPGVGISAAVWEEALRTLQEKEAAAAAAALEPVPDEMDLELLAQRTAARTAKDWAKADQLRDQLAARGWQVADTPDGPILEPVSG